MTTDELMKNSELEDYCLLNGYSIVYNRWTDSLVFSRDGNDYIVKEEFSDDDVLKAIKDCPKAILCFSSLSNTSRLQTKYCDFATMDGLEGGVLPFSMPFFVHYA
jgi:hypothetical protein